MENNNKFDYIMDLNDEEKKSWEEIFAILEKDDNEYAFYTDVNDGEKKSWEENFDILEKEKDDNKLKQEQPEKKFKINFNHPLMEVHPFLKCREDIEKIRLSVVEDFPEYASYTDDNGEIKKPPMPDYLFTLYELYYYGILTKREIESNEKIKKYNTHVINFGL